MPLSPRPIALERRQWIGVEKLNSLLAAEILARAAREPCAPTTNVGGWKSSKDLHTWRLPEVTRLVEMTSTVIGGRPILHMWAIVNSVGNSHVRHTHQGRTSGIYYVTSGGGSAATCFETGRSEVERVLPEPGLFVLFPSGMIHWVEPHDGPTERITIAFDAG